MFELWVEGAIADKADTIDFVGSPSSAAREVRSKLVGSGLIRAWVDDFLQRLVVRPDQPTRAHIDAKEAGPRSHGLGADGVPYSCALFGTWPCALGADPPMWCRNGTHPGDNRGRMGFGGGRLSPRVQDKF